MKVHFVFAPPLKKSVVINVWEAAMPPLGILYLASFLRKAIPSIDIRVTDGMLLGRNKTLEEIRAFDPNVLCVSFYTGSTLGAFELINIMKSENPHLVIITGGPHASAQPEEVLLRSKANLVVRGEGEQVLARLIRSLEKKLKFSIEDYKSFEGIAYMGPNGKVQQNSPSTLIRNLDEFPFPAWDLINPKSYRGYHLSKQIPDFPILFSRGCPHDCIFCSNEHWNLSKPKVRFRTPSNIVDEMESLVRDYGIREFNNVADELNNHPRLALEICAEIKSRKLGITWKTMLHADRVSEELVQAMAESGCWLVSLGIETGNPETMRGVRKNLTHGKIEAACRLFKKYGLKVQGLFMLYNAWEVAGELRFEDHQMSLRTYQYAKKLFSEQFIDYMAWSISTPYPGSELYQIAVKHGLIKPEMVGQWDDWVQTELFVMSLPGISQIDQVRVLRKTQTLGAKASLMRNGFRLKDVSMVAKTVIQTLRTEAALTMKRTKKKPGR